MKQNKNEELQSRRQFFKKAAKATLPILGAIVLANVPLNLAASNINMGCGEDSCHNGCKGNCSGNCDSSCEAGCDNSCKGGCDGSCKGGCEGSSRIF